MYLFSSCILILDTPIDFTCTGTGGNVLNVTENEPFNLQCSVTCDPVCSISLYIYDMNAPLNYYNMGFPSGSVRTTSTVLSGAVRTYTWIIALPDTYDQSYMRIRSSNKIGYRDIFRTVNIICK